MTGIVDTCYKCCNTLTEFIFNNHWHIVGIGLCKCAIYKSIYSAAAKLALDAAEIVTEYETADVVFTFPYIGMNDVMRAVKDPEIKIVGQEFDNTCRMTLRIRADRADALRRKLDDISGVSVE